MPVSDVKGFEMKSTKQKLKEAIHVLYGPNRVLVEEQMDRYKKLSDQFKSHFKAEELHFFSTPGRTELGGNHTDHNHGRVLAASINLDSIAVVSKSDNNKIEFTAGVHGEKGVGILRTTGKAIIVEDPGTKQMIANTVPWFLEFWESHEDPYFTLIQLDPIKVLFDHPDNGLKYFTNF